MWSSGNCHNLGNKEVHSVLPSSPIRGGGQLLVKCVNLGKFEFFFNIQRQTDTEKTRGEIDVMSNMILFFEKNHNNYVT